MTIDKAIKFCDKIIRNVILEFADALSLDNWIPVSERLPEEGQYVLVTFCGKIVGCLAHDNNGTLQEITSFVFFKKYNPNLWLYPEDEWGDGYAIWTPLPEESIK